MPAVHSKNWDTGRSGSGALNLKAPGKQFRSVSQILIEPVGPGIREDNESAPLCHEASQSLHRQVPARIRQYHNIGIFERSGFCRPPVGLLKFQEAGLTPI